MESVSERLASVRERMSCALRKAGRATDSARLVAVSKTFPAEAIATVREAGQLLFGENRVQELAGKVPVLPQDIEWHPIGHLQANKVRAAVNLAAWIHSIDTADLLRRVIRIAAEENRAPRLLLEVNVSGEASKFGMRTDEVEATVAACPTPLLCGLMTVAPAEATETELHRVFASLRELRDRVSAATGQPLPELSMGMSGDFEIALAEGATLVRVGSAIFGHRDYTAGAPG